MGIETQIALLVVCFLLSAFFSASETAFTAIDRVDLHRRMQAGDKKSGAIDELLKKPRRLLAAILIGNNLVNTGAAALASALTIDIVAKTWKGSEAIGILVATVATTIILVVFSEILPKSVALLYPFVWARLFRPLIAFWVKFTMPLAYGVNLVTNPIIKVMRKVLGKSDDSDSEATALIWLRSAFMMTARDAELSDFMRILLSRVVHLPQMKISERMIPRTELVSVEASETIAKVKEIYKDKRASRIFVYEGTSDEDLGFIHIKDVMTLQTSEDTLVRDLVRKAPRLHESSTVDVALETFQREGIQFAVVKDEYGGTMGIVTTEDLVEAMIGAIRDEFSDPERERIKPIPGGGYLIAGHTAMRDVTDIVTDLYLTEEERSENVALWMQKHTGDRAKLGQRFETETWSFIVDRTRHGMVARLRLQPKPQTDLAKGGGI
ncbi:MAG: hemolysin family protein [Planctomycetes bacterium]|nr:hemolysin family protein [Planctomycetota bacterium]